MVYPKPATPWRALPDELLHQLHLVFEKDLREAFPARLLETLCFRRCERCGIEHAREACPGCAPGATHGEVVVTVRGDVTATRRCETSGRIVFAAIGADGSPTWLSQEGEILRREDGGVIDEGARLDPSAKVRLRGAATLIARGGDLAIFSPGCRPERLSVDVVGGEPAFDANAHHAYWAQGGLLLRDGRFGPETIGTTLAGQTRLFVGERFGVGFYRAGRITVGFVFDAERPGVKELAAFPRLSGQLVEAACTFDGERAWLSLATQEAGRTTHRCVALRADGATLGEAEATAGDDSWLGVLGGAAAAGAFLLAPTDAGIVRVEVRGGRIEAVRTFPDTESFVDARSRLLVERAGILVVGGRTITALRMA
ncbi:MAG: hypothetical protein EXR72_00915 [Myxococcales bacterium]|nr:hypothetical protein [Myxococcales bacterium]